MKKLSALLILVFLGTTLPLQAQTVTTWIQPRNLTTNQTLLLGQNQVMEVMSLLLDNSTSIDITVEGQTLTLGRNGVNTYIPPTLVIAGPATVVMRRSVSGDEGSMMTFRVMQIESPGRETQISSR